MFSNINQPDVDVDVGVLCSSPMSYMLCCSMCASISQIHRVHLSAEWRYALSMSTSLRLSPQYKTKSPIPIPSPGTGNWQVGTGIRPPQRRHFRAQFSGGEDPPERDPTDPKDTKDPTEKYIIEYKMASGFVHGVFFVSWLCFVFFCVSLQLF